MPGINEIQLEELGLGSDNSKVSCGCSEYYDVESEKPVWFVFSNDQGGANELVCDYVDVNAGRAAIPVKVVS